MLNLRHRTFIKHEVRRLALGDRRRAIRRQRCQHSRRVSHQRPQPLGGVRERDESVGGAWSQRDRDHVIPAKKAGGQLHGHRRVGRVPVRGEHRRLRHGAQIPEQRVRQPVVHIRPPDEPVPAEPKDAGSASAAQKRHEIRRGLYRNFWS